jgi:hypothetical protein
VPIGERPAPQRRPQYVRKPRLTAAVHRSRRRCGPVPAQMWAGPGHSCGPVPAQMWASPGADVARLE